MAVEPTMAALDARLRKLEALVDSMRRLDQLQGEIRNLEEQIKSAEAMRANLERAVPGATC